MQFYDTIGSFFLLLRDFYDIDRNYTRQLHPAVGCLQLSVEGQVKINEFGLIWIGFQHLKCKGFSTL